jgi:hypothetical protein
VYLLGQACELEHGLMCEYPYTQFSLKRGLDEGRTVAQLDGVEDVPLAVGFRWGLHDGSYFQVPTAGGRSSRPGSSAVARSSAKASWGSSW